MNYSQLHIIQTADGSNTLAFADEDEHYHSTNGAFSESMHVYINAGLQEVCKRKHEINILEIGFGTGLNAYLSKLFAEKHHLTIQYTSLEAFPLEKAIYSQLNYAEIAENGKQEDFLQLHTCEWDTVAAISPQFTLHKQKTTAEAFLFPENTFDLIYFDAFAPRFQPGLWTEEIFSKVYFSMKPNAILTTYCCKGDVKRTLLKTGFSIEKLPGFNGKREMLRAEKKLLNYHL